MPKRFLLSEPRSFDFPQLATFAVTAVVMATVIAITAIVLRASRGVAAAEPVKSQKQLLVPQNVRFTIYPEGIHPATVTVHTGLISIAIEDLAGTENGVLIERLNPSEQASVGSVQRFQRHWRGRSQIEVTPGVYCLRVPGRQIEEAQITVEP